MRSTARCFATVSEVAPPGACGSDLARSELVSKRLTQSTAAVKLSAQPGRSHGRVRARHGRRRRCRDASVMPAVLPEVGKPCKAGLSGSRSVSGILSRTVIHLGRPLPAGSCRLPEARRAASSLLFDVAPGGACLATHVSAGAGGLLHHRFNLTADDESPVGGLLSVALSIGFPRPGVTRHPALRCPDFPRRPKPPRLSDRHARVYRAGVTVTTEPGVVYARP